MRPEALAFEHRSVGRSGLRGAMKLLDPGVLLVGGLSPLIAGQVAHFADRRPVPFGVWNGEIDTRSTANSRLRRIQRRWILRRASFAISYGSRSADTSARSPRNSPSSSGATRRRSRRPSRVSPALRSRPSRSAARCRSSASTCSSTLWTCCVTSRSGSPSSATARSSRRYGSRRSRSTMCASSGRCQRRRAAAYAEADVFLFPSRDDVFGLVLVEAMGAGLPSVVSSRPGAVADLVVPASTARSSTATRPGRGPRPSRRWRPTTRAARRTGLRRAGPSSAAGRSTTPPTR